MNETLFSLLVTMAVWQQKKMEFQNWQQQILHFPSGEQKEGRIFQTFLPQQVDFTCPPWTSAKETTGLMTREYDLFT